MPNWVRNIVWLSGNKEKIAALKTLVKSDNRKFDFNKIIPMPEELNIQSGGKEPVAIACAKARMRGETTCTALSKYSWAEKEMSFKAWADLGDKYLKNKKKYGFTTWYDWCWNNWGTKWNACEAKWKTERCVVFDTAWAAPFPIFEKLADKFPCVKITVNYADEDIGYNCDACSVYVDNKGKLIYQRPALYVDGSEKAQRFAREVWGLGFDSFLSDQIEDELVEPDADSILTLLK